MNKVTIAGVVATALLVLPFASSAATVSNLLFDNGDTTISGAGGSTVNASLHIVVPTNQVVEIVRTQVTSPTVYAAVCTEVGDNLGLQEGEYDVSIPVKLPPNTNTYNLTVQTIGTYGGIHAVCTDTPNGTATFSNAIRVTAGGSSNTGGTAISDLQSLIASLTAQIGCLGSGGTWSGTACVPKPVPPPVVVPPECAAYTAAAFGSVPGTHNEANVKLQGFLLSQGLSIPWLAAGAAFGFDGPQTEAARAQFLSMHHC